MSLRLGGRCPERSSRVFFSFTEMPAGMVYRVFLYINLVILILISLTQNIRMSMFCIAKISCFGIALSE